MIKVSEVQIIPIKPNGGLVAFASFVFGDQLYLTSVGIHSKLDGSGFRLTYPTKQVGGKDLNIYHPINRETSEAIEKEVISKFKEVMKKSNDRHNNFNNA